MWVNNPDVKKNTHWEKMLNLNCKWQKDKSNHMTVKNVHKPKAISSDCTIRDRYGNMCQYEDVRPPNDASWWILLRRQRRYSCHRLGVYNPEEERRRLYTVIQSICCTHKHATRGNKKPRLTGRTWKVLGYHHIKVCLNAFTQYYSARWGKQMKASFFCSDVKPQLEDSH